jgi:CheY-like chemotaxis protein
MKTILFADDRKSIREYCRASLEDEGYHVLLACDGLDAIRVCREEAPDLAVLDVSMPRASGLEALERIRGFAPQVPVILFTAHAEDCLQDRRASLAAACIRKADDLSELKRAIAGALDARDSGVFPSSAQMDPPPSPLNVPR